jgi:hypothetical protein
MSMSNGRRLSRGDNRRNARLTGLRAVLPREHAILALDLAADKQVFVLTDHDSRVLARRTVRCRPWQLAEAIAWGRRRAAGSGFAGVTLACEPTGHRWKVVAELAACKLSCWEDEISAAIITSPATAHTTAGADQAARLRTLCHQVAGRALWRWRVRRHRPRSRCRRLRQAATSGSRCCGWSSPALAGCGDLARETVFTSWYVASPGRMVWRDMSRCPAIVLAVTELPRGQRLEHRDTNDVFAPGAASMA